MLLVKFQYEFARGSLSEFCLFRLEPRGQFVKEGPCPGIDGAATVLIRDCQKSSQ